MISIPIARSRNQRKIHVDLAALAHRLSLNLWLETGVLRPFCAQVCGPVRSPEERADGDALIFDRDHLCSVCSGVKAHEDAIYLRLRKSKVAVCRSAKDLDVVACGVEDFEVHSL
jgi:hypothetical protein